MGIIMTLVSRRATEGDLLACARDVEKEIGVLEYRV